MLAHCRGKIVLVKKAQTVKESEKELTHIDAEGRLQMVDVSAKEVTYREARAEAAVFVSPETLQRILHQRMPKGNVFEAARLAGILAAKRTSDLIPLCHPIQPTEIKIDFAADTDRDRILITSQVKTRDRTGVEMEALVAVTNAALTIYDMCKAVDRNMKITDVQLTYKSGGRSGTYQRS
jgi:cyclic pyranopterin monophosphate synthase